MADTAITTIMTTDTEKLLRLKSWLSPAFPIGAFSYSHALEWAVEEGSVTDRVTLVDWLDADLRHGAGRMDGVFFAQSWRAMSGEADGRLCVSTNSDCPLPDGERLPFAIKAHDWERADAEGGRVRGRLAPRLTPPRPSPNTQ
jgi:hypothetical protein